MLLFHLIRHLERVLRANLLLGVIALPTLIDSCHAESSLREFAGTWVLKYQNRNFLALTLRVDQDEISDNLVCPEHFSFDQGSDFSRITSQHEQRIFCAVLGPILLARYFLRVSR